MWVPMAADLVRDRTVVVPDLRGLGLSVQTRRRLRQEDTRPRRRRRARRAEDRAGGSRRPRHRQHGRLSHSPRNTASASGDFVLIDAPVPGVGPWEEILKNPLLWHFRFGGPDMERLVAGRERIYLDRFWNEFSATPSRFTEAARDHYAKLYALPGAMHCGLHAVRGFRPGCRWTTRRSWQGKPPCPCWRSVARNLSGRPWPRSCALPPATYGRRRPRLRSLDHGGEPRRHHRVGAWLPRCGVSGPRFAAPGLGNTAVMHAVTASRSISRL